MVPAQQREIVVVPSNLLLAASGSVYRRCKPAASPVPLPAEQFAMLAVGSGEDKDETEAAMADPDNAAGTGKHEREPWEKRHENDGRGPLADNSSTVPDRDADLPEGSPGEAAPISGDGFQTPSDAAHPTFPDQGSGKTDRPKP